MTFWAVDTNRWFLFVTNSPSEGPSANPWRKKQSEGVTLLIVWRENLEKILNDWSVSATLKAKIGYGQETDFFRAAAKSKCLSHVAVLNR